jgi:hypothetical protein
MEKKILFVSTMNLSTNPRIFKEIRLAQTLNYKITFLGFNLGNWSDGMDREIQNKHDQPEYLYLDASRKRFYRWLRHSLLERFNRLVWKFNKGNLFLTSTAISKRTFALLDFAKNVKGGDFDLVIGHTLGSFYPASVIAHKAQCPFAVDMEDYHPGEHIGGNKVDEIKRRKLIMKRILPDAEYVSASSPLIGQFTGELTRLNKGKIIPVLNYFSAAEFKPPVVNNTRKIKMIWFSQFISRGRGLEIILASWDKLKGDFDLTLVGGSDQSFVGDIRDGIKIVEPIRQAELHELLGQYDIGLALDLSSRDFNRDIALTNKILAYYQAGLYILATDTAAQKDFVVSHPGSGKLFAQNESASLLTALKDIKENIEQIRSGSIKRYKDAAMQSWENESDKLKTIWERILN